MVRMNNPRKKNWQEIKIFFPRKKVNCFILHSTPLKLYHTLTTFDAPQEKKSFWNIVGKGESVGNSVLMFLITFSLNIFYSSVLDTNLTKQNEIQTYDKYTEEKDKNES